MYDARTNLSAEVSEEARRHLGDAVFQTVIPRSVRLSEAPSYGRPIALYSPESKGAAAYRAFANELRAREATQPTVTHGVIVQAGGSWGADVVVAGAGVDA